MPGGGAVPISLQPAHGTLTRPGARRGYSVRGRTAAAVLGRLWDMASSSGSTRGSGRVWKGGWSTAPSTSQKAQLFEPGWNHTALPTGLRGAALPTRPPHRPTLADLPASLAPGRPGSG